MVTGGGHAHAARPFLVAEPLEVWAHLAREAEWVRWVRSGVGLGSVTPSGLHASPVSCRCPGPRGAGPVSGGTGSLPSDSLPCPGSFGRCLPTQCTAGLSPCRKRGLTRQNPCAHGPCFLKKGLVLARLLGGTV